MQRLRPLGEALAFSLELAMLVAFGYWGFRQHEPAALRWLLGLGVPALVVVVWGIFLAPRSRRRLGRAGVAALSLALFELAALALFRAGQSTLALAFAITAVVSVSLSVALKR